MPTDLPLPAQDVRPTLIRPTSIGAYFDKIQLWFRRPLSARVRSWLEMRCALYPIPMPTDLYWPYAEGFQIKQSIQPEVFHWLSCLDQRAVLFNAAEAAVDWVFDTQTDLWKARGFFEKHAVKRWNRGRDVIYSKETRYVGRQGGPNVLGNYSDKPSRITGELFCLHVEWRMNGAGAMERANVQLPNLSDFDFRAFWSKRLLLGTVDRQALGRLVCNRFRRSRRREWIDTRRRIPYDFHLRAGSILVGALEDRSTQGIINAYGADFNLMRSLVRFDVSHLLPE